MRGSRIEPIPTYYSSSYCHCCCTKEGNLLGGIVNLLGVARGTFILGEVRNVEISKVTQQLLCGKSHDFLSVFALAHSKINQVLF